MGLHFGRLADHTIFTRNQNTVGKPRQGASISMAQGTDFLAPFYSVQGTLSENKNTFQAVFQIPKRGGNDEFEVRLNYATPDRIEGTLPRGLKSGSKLDAAVFTCENDHITASTDRELVAEEAELIWDAIDLRERIAQEPEKSFTLIDPNP